MSDKPKKATKTKASTSLKKELSKKPKKVESKEKKPKEKKEKKPKEKKDKPKKSKEPKKAPSLPERFKKTKKFQSAVVHHILSSNKDLPVDKQSALFTAVVEAFGPISTSSDGKRVPSHENLVPLLTPGATAETKAFDEAEVGAINKFEKFMEKAHPELWATRIPAPTPAVCLPQVISQQPVTPDPSSSQETPSADPTQSAADEAEEEDESDESGE
jgi:hypothetical protein